MPLTIIRTDAITAPITPRMPKATKNCSISWPEANPAPTIRPMKAMPIPTARLSTDASLDDFRGPQAACRSPRHCTVYVCRAGEHIPVHSGTVVHCSVHLYLRFVHDRPAPRRGGGSRPADRFRPRRAFYLAAAAH